MHGRKTLVVLTGPTGSGKSDLAVEIAEALETEIVSADSRQIFKGIPIATAVPGKELRERVRHHLVETLPLDSYYSAAMFEQEALGILDAIWRKSDYAVMCGGSMMYVDAVCKGIDLLPTISDEVRREALAIYENGGLEALRETLRRIDPDYLATADPMNHRRLVHAIEITMQAGVPCSRLRTGARAERPFGTVMLAIGHSREALFGRINRRVERMVEAGLEQEARAVYRLRHLNSLNTVGLKEMFAYIDGQMDLATATARMAKNTRVYAKKQLLWLSKQTGAAILDPSGPMLGEALRIINSGA